MDLLPDLGFGLYYAWMFSSTYFILSIVLLLLFPRHNIGKFTNTIKIKYINPANYILYYGFLIFSIFIPLKLNSLFFYFGTGFFISGMILYALSLFSFAVTEYDRPTINRIYKYSRHPVYVSFLILSVGIALSAASVILMTVAILHFISSVFIMKKEELMCIEKYGKEYQDYMYKTRMII